MDRTDDLGDLGGINDIDELDGPDSAQDTRPQKRDAAGRFAIALLRRREALFLTQEELAERVGIDPRSIRRYEQGTLPGVRFLGKLVEALKLEGSERDAFVALYQASKRPLEAGAAPTPVTPPTPATGVTIGAETDEQGQEQEHHEDGDGQPTVFSRNNWPRRDVRVVRAAIMLVLLLVVELASMAGLQLIRQPDAPGYKSLVQNVADEVLCPDATPLCETAEGSVQGHVHMVCWQDGLTTYGRWFYVYAPNGTEGFMRAGTVSQQTGTPKCTTLTWINAAWWLLIHDGRPAQLAAAAIRDGVTAHVSWDVLLVYDAWKLGAGHTPTEVGATAQQTWALYQAHGLGHAPGKAPPRGSLVFFADGASGRVALSLGNGWVELPQSVATTDASAATGIESSQQTPLTHLSMTKLGLAQLGYVPPMKV